MAARKPISRKTTSGMSESVRYNKSLNKTEESAFDLYIKNDSSHTYIASPNGFWYKYNIKVEGDYLPQVGDKVFFEFEVSNIDNSSIYKKEELGRQEYFVDEQEIVEGLRHGLKLMNVGDNITFLFPSHIAYGFTGDDNKIGINQPLIYTVQLNKINKKNESN
jgi:gliding motility-associated peptidyl-prolyl isomerase